MTLSTSLPAPMAFVLLGLALGGSNRHPLESSRAIHPRKDIPGDIWLAGSQRRR